MRLLIDLTGSVSPSDDLDLLQDAQSAVIDLLLPDAVLDRHARDRLATLLRILHELRTAVVDAAAAA